MMAKLAMGSSQRKTGSARRSSPQDLENHRGTASGKLVALLQIRKMDRITKDRLTTKLINLAEGRVFNFINSQVFIRSKKIIAGRENLHKSIKDARGQALD